MCVCMCVLPVGEKPVRATRVHALTCQCLHVGRGLLFDMLSSPGRLLFCWHAHFTRTVIVLFTCSVHRDCYCFVDMLSSPERLLFCWHAQFTRTIIVLLTCSVHQDDYCFVDMLSSPGRLLFCWHAQFTKTIRTTPYSSWTVVHHLWTSLPHPHWTSLPHPEHLKANIDNGWHALKTHSCWVLLLDRMVLSIMHCLIFNKPQRF